MESDEISSTREIRGSESREKDLSLRVEIDRCSDKSRWIVLGTKMMTLEGNELKTPNDLG